VGRDGKSNKPYKISDLQAMKQQIALIDAGSAREFAAKSLFFTVPKEEFSDSGQNSMIF
jgi:hypothetical protein